jgi:imidazolonepropionase-like amidohydrolase
MRLLLAALLQASVAFVGVNVVHVEGESALAQTVIVTGDRITEIGPVSEVIIPQDARVVYGGTLAPGLMDMHVHLREVDLPRYVESGITLVRDMAGLDSVLRTAARVRNGELPGPEIVIATKLLNGPNPTAPSFATIVPSAAAAASTVDAELARGCDFVKLYQNLQPPVYDAIVAAARARRVRVGGHVSEHVAIEHAIASQDTIEHLSGYRGRTDLTALAEASRASGVWNCPTLKVLARPANRAIVKALHDAGARLLAGTDAGYLLPAGTALFDEFDEMRAAGLPPRAILASATIAPAEYLGRSNELGRVEVGYVANLVLLDGDPLADLATLRKPRGVMIRGSWTPLNVRRRAVRR